MRNLGQSRLGDVVWKGGLGNVVWSFECNFKVVNGDIMENKAPSILIIEDDNRNIFALSLVLKSKGYGCLAATSAKEGMALLEDFPGLAIVLLDMMIPEVDGYEAIDLLRKVPGRESLPIIAVTAQAMPGDAEKCLAAGANAYVSKPIDVELLLGLLVGFLKQNLS